MRRETFAMTIALLAVVFSILQPVALRRATSLNDAQSRSQQDFAPGTLSHAPGGARAGRPYSGAKPKSAVVSPRILQGFRGRPQRQATDDLVFCSRGVTGVRMSEGGNSLELPGPLANLLPVTDPSARAIGVKGVVITGGAGGVGYAYADELLRLGHAVVICDVKDPVAPVEALKEKYGKDAKIFGTVCDVSSAESVEAFGAFAKESLGTIHHWINNAGINGGRRPFTTVPTKVLEAVVNVNLVGLLLCTKVAMDILSEQTGVTGHIWETVGSGVKGGGTPGYAAYGATKRGLPQLKDSLVAELTKGVPGYEQTKTAGEVCVHTLSPGMVFTDLLLDDSTPELRKFPFGVLAAQPPEVAADLVPKILGVKGQGKKVEFLTTDKVLTKFFERFIQGKKSEYIDDDGNVIKKPGAQYADNGVRIPY